MMQEQDRRREGEREGRGDDGIGKEILHGRLRARGAGGYAMKEHSGAGRDKRRRTEIKAPGFAPKA